MGLGAFGDMESTFPSSDSTFLLWNEHYSW